MVRERQRERERTKYEKKKFRVFFAKIYHCGAMWHWLQMHAWHVWDPVKYLMYFRDPDG